MNVLDFVEIKCRYCALLYGVSPCAAAIGVTGAAKCFNTPGTCQDAANFDNEPASYLFTRDGGFLPEGVDAIPSIESIRYSAATLSLGRNLGQRASISVTMRDHRWPDSAAGYDKYHAEREYDPFSQGSYWGKFRARHQFLRGQPLVHVRGAGGQAFEEMERRHFVIDGTNGPTPDGVYTVTAKDPLKLADGDRALAPKPSPGRLSGAIDDSETSATLAPVDIGDASYPASGHVTIGGKEICAFTRAGDVLTLTRGQLGTPAIAHAAEDRIQLVLSYTSTDVADIIDDLVTNYVGLPEGWTIPIDEWKEETTNFLQRVYTGIVAEPTPVKRLLEELIEQAGLAIWADDLARAIRLQVLRGISTEATMFDDSILSTLDSREQPEQTITSVHTYYGKINPVEKHEEKDNYSARAVTVNVEAVERFGSESIKEIYSRWIPQVGEAIALKLNDLLLSRFSTPPRKFSFPVFRNGLIEPRLGAGARVKWWNLQDASGAIHANGVPVQITRVSPEPDRYDVEAEEMLIGWDVDFGRVVTVNSDIANLNLLAAHNLLYPAIPSDEGEGVVVKLIVAAGANIYSTTNELPALTIGDWPEGVTIEIYIRGRIQGFGGGGGQGGRQVNTNGPVSGAPGQNGGPALYTRFPVNIFLYPTGEIFGGGGGGGGGAGDSPSGTGLTNAGSGGGGGAGNTLGPAGPAGVKRGGAGEPIDGNPGEPGTLDEGGLGGVKTFWASGSGGKGGDPGEDGEDGEDCSRSGSTAIGGAGGTAGAAIDGISFVTFEENDGEILGATVN